MKVGDKVYCIQYLQTDFAVFIKDNFYYIDKMFDDGYILIKGDKVIYFGTGFELHEERSNRYFYKYFLTMEMYNRMVRKNKLLKINEEGR